MFLTTEFLQNALGYFGLYDEIKNLHKYLDIQQEDYFKIIMKVELETGNPLVIKVYSQTEGSTIEHEQQGAFAEHLRRKGIPTPKRYAAGDQYCLDFKALTPKADIIVEQWCGECLQTINFSSAYEAGKLMAKMHTVSLRDNCSVSANTLFNAVDTNDVSGYSKFSELLAFGLPDETLSRGIVQKHNALLSNARELWDELPCCAVQGDISINNLSYVNDVLYVYDFNNAGNVVLVSDLVLEGLLTAYEMDLGKDLTEADRPALFKQFFQGYESIRPLSANERNAARYIYPAFDALWFSRIFDYSDPSSDHSLERAVKTGHVDSVHEILHDINNRLDFDAGQIFL